MANETLQAAALRYRADQRDSDFLVILRELGPWLTKTTNSLVRSFAPFPCIEPDDVSSELHVALLRMARPGGSWDPEKSSFFTFAFSFAGHHARKALALAARDMTGLKAEGRLDSHAESLDVNLFDGDDGLTAIETLSSTPCAATSPTEYLCLSQLVAAIEELGAGEELAVMLDAEDMETGPVASKRRQALKARLRAGLSERGLAPGSL